MVDIALCLREHITMLLPAKQSSIAPKSLLPVEPMLQDVRVCTLDFKGQSRGLQPKLAISIGLEAEAKGKGCAAVSRVPREHQGPPLHRIKQPPFFT